MDPREVSRRLGIQPTSLQLREAPGRVMAKFPRAPMPGGWFLVSEGSVDSRDVRAHVDWLLHHLAGKDDDVRALQDAGCAMDVFCYWMSRSGHGGPALSPAQMARLAALNLEISFDVYFAGPRRGDRRTHAGLRVP